MNFSPNESVATNGSNNLRIRAARRPKPISSAAESRRTFWVELSRDSKGTLDSDQRARTKRLALLRLLAAGPLRRRLTFLCQFPAAFSTGSSFSLWVPSCSLNPRVDRRKTDSIARQSYLSQNALHFLHAQNHWQLLLARRSY